MLLCVVRTIKVFFIISVYRATVIGAMLTLQTEIIVFGKSGTTQTGLYGPQYVVWCDCLQTTRVYRLYVRCYALQAGFEVCLFILTKRQI